VKRVRLIDARKKRGLTQAKVAEMASIERTRYVYIETGRAVNVSIEEALGISHSLGVRPEDIFLPAKAQNKHQRKAQ